jgi:protein-S-isoprenylcysteine O-methyltransferase Ste14
MSANPRAVVHVAWWKGPHGEWFVIAQVVLMMLVLFGPRALFGLPSWQFPFPHACAVAGVALMVAGGVLFAAGLASLGRGLTPLPHPKDGAELIQTGAYALVRHPLYCGGLIFCLGWALFVQGWLTLVYVAALFVLLDRKSRREENLLAEKFPAYAAYQRRVRRLVPFIY